MRITYGDGKIHTQQGVTSDGLKCITLLTMAEAQPVGSSPVAWKQQQPESEFDCVLAFKNIEGARVLQDELNELISIWSKELGPKVPTFETSSATV